MIPTDAKGPTPPGPPKSGACLAIDPGSDKCGLAVVAADGAILYRAVVATPDLARGILWLLNEYRLSAVLMGDGTGSKQLQAVVQEALQQGLCKCPLQVVSERHTTERARDEYWKHNPPTGWKRLVPLSLQFPAQPIDDFAAVVMARDYLQKTGRPGANEV